MKLSLPFARSFGSDTAERYDSKIAMVVPGYDALQRLTAATLGAALSGPSRILIAGCGTGNDILSLARMDGGWRYVAVDASGEMLGKCRDKLKAAGLDARTDFFHGTVDALPEEPVFDAAVALLVQHFLPDDGRKSLFLSSIASRLRRGAPFLLADYVQPEEPGTSEAWSRYQALLGRTSAEIGADRKSMDLTVHAVTEKRTQELLAERGFAPAAVYFSALMFRGWITRKE